MDALNASSDAIKRKTPRRTRRLSSREDSKEEKKAESTPTTPTPTPTTPPAATSPVAAKPLLKVGRSGSEGGGSVMERAGLFSLSWWFSV